LGAIVFSHSVVGAESSPEDVIKAAMAKADSGDQDYGSIGATAAASLARFDGKVATNALFVAILHANENQSAALAATGRRLRNFDMDTWVSKSESQSDPGLLLTLIDVASYNPQAPNEKLTRFLWKLLDDRRIGGSQSGEGESEIFRVCDYAYVFLLKGEAVKPPGYDLIPKKSFEVRDQMIADYKKSRGLKTK
jgi:hypothetical protein